jgi:type IV secretion system protein VirD4
LLNSICYAVYYEFAFKDQNFATVSELLNMCGSSENDDNYKSDYDIWLDHLQEHSPMGEEHPAVVWRKKVSASGREMSSIISTAQTAVRLFASKDIQRLTNVDTLEMDKIGDRPTAFFIIIPTTNSTYNFLISMMYTQLFESLYYRAQNVFHGSLPHHVVFMQDEMANVGKIPDFDKKIATFRSVNLSTCMIVQSPNQIETVYDKAATDILDNVHMIVFLGSGGQGEKSATKWMSAALGYKTIQAEQSSVKMGKGPDLLGLDGTTVEHSYTATQRLLMTPDELYRMPSDRCIVMIKGQKPFYDYKIDLNTSLNFASDLYSEADGSRRRLKKSYFYPVNDKDPEHPSRKRTLASYHQGVKNAEVVDQEREQMQREEMMENEKYNPVANSPVRPEPQPAAEVIHADHMEHYHAAGCNDRELKVEDFFDEEENL